MTIRSTSSQVPPLLVPPRPGSTKAILAKYKLLRSAAMAKREIKTRTLNVFTNLWWHFMPGTIITVKWPVGWVVLHDDGNGGITSVESADPNDHYRPLLTQLCGNQGWDWDWRIGNFVATNGSTFGHDTIEIKIRKGKDDCASFLVLKWG